MATDGLQVKVKSSGRFKAPNLDNGQLTSIGREMVAAQKARWAQAVNAQGNPAKRLSMKYTFEKKAFTGQSRPKRDMKMTGRTLENFTLRKAIDMKIRAENTTRLERAKATRSQMYDQMIGFASTDQQVVFRGASREYGQWARKAWVKIS